MCQGDKLANNWFDFRPEAAWWSSQPTIPSSDHVINTIIGWSPWHYHFDWLHCVDLGTTSHALGNLFFEIVYVSLKNKSRATACQQLAAVVLHESARSEHGSPISSLELKHFVADTSRPHKDYPQLHHLKAGEVRSLIAAGVALAREYNDGSPKWKHILRLMTAQSNMYNILYMSGIVMTAEQYNIFQQSIKMFLLSYTWLGRQSVQESTLRWSMIPKHHYLGHIMQTSRFLNPRFTWCYGGEDLVGKISCLAHSCVAGTSSVDVQSKVLAKYRLAKHVSWHLQ
jgi:hypothetical protein